MNILNDRFWVSRSHKDKNPAELLAHFIQKLVSEFADNDSSSLDYKAFLGSSLYEEINDFLPALAEFDPAVAIDDAVGRRGFWLNTYNMLSVCLATKYHDLPGVKDISGGFTDYGFKVSGSGYSLDIIEHGILRGNAPRYRGLTGLLDKNDERLLQVLTLDPRVHFAMHVATRSSPRLRVYRGKDFDNTINAATREYLLKLIMFKSSSQEVFLPKVLDWYRKDFGEKSGTIDYLFKLFGDSLSARQKLLLETGKLRFLDYDWSWNQS